MELALPWNGLVGLGWECEKLRITEYNFFFELIRITEYNIYLLAQLQTANSICKLFWCKELMQTSYLSCIRIVVLHWFTTQNNKKKEKNFSSKSFWACINPSLILYLLLIFYTYTLESLPVKIHLLNQKKIMYTY